MRALSSVTSPPCSTRAELVVSSLDSATQVQYGPRLGVFMTPPSLLPWTPNLTESELWKHSGWIPSPANNSLPPLTLSISPQDGLHCMLPDPAPVHGTVLLFERLEGKQAQQPGDSELVFR